MKPEELSICMYTPSAFGGHALYTQDLLSAMSEVGRDKGVRVSLVTSSDLEPSYRTSLYPIHDILPPLRHRSEFQSTLHWGISRMTHYARRERAFLRWVEQDGSCEGIHFQEYTPWLAPKHFRLLRARGIRLFCSAHHVYPPTRDDHSGIPDAETFLRSTLYRLSRSRAWASHRLCDALFVHTEGIREQLAKSLGEGHPPIFVAPYGVPNVADGTHTALSVEERVQRRRLLFFGHNSRMKLLPVLLRAMKGLDDCTLTVAGPPEDPRYQEQIRDLVKALPHGRVELIDDRFIEGDEKARLFEQSSLVVLPYGFFTGTSGVLHDALAYGLPVVASDVGALGESVRHWGIGQVVPPNDAAALADAIRGVLTAQRYAEASRAVDRARKDRSWNRTAEIILDAYRSVWQR